MSLEKNLKTIVPSISLIVCLTGLPQLSETIYSPALPDIANRLATTQHWVQWTLSIYFWGFALGVLFWGRYSDYVGRRHAMHGGYVIYILASLGCMFSSSISMLLFFRFLQAFGASVGSVITQVILRDRFTGKQRHKLFSVVGYALAFAPTLGPLIGGYVVQQYNWQANFFVLVIFGLFVLSYSWIKLPETKLDVNVEKNHRPKLSKITRTILKDRHVLICAFLVGGFNGMLFSYYAEAPFIFINILHLSPKQYGLLGIIISAGYLIGSFLSNKLNDYYPPQRLIELGCGISLFSNLILLILVYSGLINPSNENISVILILISMLFFFVAFSLAIPNILSIALVNYTHYTGSASSIFGFFYYCLIAVFTFIIGSLPSDTLIVMPVYFSVINLLMVSSCLLKNLTLSTSRTSL